MNITELEEQGFTIKTSTFGGEELVLVIGEGFDVKWNEDNLIYRSSIWRIFDNKPISLSYKKFFNWGEKSDLISEPISIEESSLVSKIDGSAFIISKFNENLITRTRGTFSIVDGDYLNKDEALNFQKEYPKLFDNKLINTEEYSIVCEWYSPKNIIIINYGDKPKLFLTGIIRHEDYAYLSQKEVDQYAVKWNVERPEYHNYNTISSMVEAVKAFKNKEGICIYYNNGQDIKKLKSLDYLAKHNFKNNMTLDSLVELYVQFGYPEYNEFHQKISETFDYECANMSIGLCSKIADSMKEVKKIIKGMEEFVEGLKDKTRKEAALKIIESYGQTNRSSFVFSLLDGKKLKDEQLKKLIFQCIR